MRVALVYIGELIASIVSDCQLCYYSFSTQVSMVHIEGIHHICLVLVKAMGPVSFQVPLQMHPRDAACMSMSIIRFLNNEIQALIAALL